MSEQRLEGRGWWRRNASALVAVLVLAVATVGITSAREWSDYFSGRPTQAVTAQPGETATLDGSTFRLADVREEAFGEGEVGEALPAGTKAIVVSIDVDAEEGGALPAGCLVSLDETGGSHGDRTWDDASLAPVEIPMSEDAVGYCASDAAGPYTLEVPFIVPENADGALTVSVLVAESVPRFVQLRLPE